MRKVVKRVCLLVLVIAGSVAWMGANSCNPCPPLPTGERLERLAPPDFGIGGVLHAYSSDSAFVDYRTTANREFNAITVTAYMPWGPWPPDDENAPLVRPTQGPNMLPFVDTSTWATDNHKRVHGHALVYPYANTHLPWYQALPNGDVEATLSQFVAAAASSAAGQVWVWDVVNEAMGDPGEYDNRSLTDEDGVRKGVWRDNAVVPFKEYTALGQTYIDKAFEWAAAADPNALLILNDYGAEEINEKSDRLLDFAIKLRDRQVPIDGVGFQSHWLDSSGSPNYTSIRDNFQRFADAGFLVFITEADVAARQTDDIDSEPTVPELERQRDIYAALLDIALEQPACKAFLLWDFADRQSWVHPTRSPLGDIPAGSYLFPTPFEGGDLARQFLIRPKLAYYALQETLEAHQDVFRITSAWGPDDGNIARVGVLNGNGEYDPTSAIGFYPLNEQTSAWSSMKWTIERVAGRMYRVRATWDGATGYLTRVGSTVTLSPLDASSPAQRWSVFPDSSALGSFRLRSEQDRDSGFLTRGGVPDGAGGYTPGGDLQMHPFQENWSSQVWSFARVD